METLLQDLKYGLRVLAKSKAFTAVAVLTLALGIGANTAMFSVVNAVLLRPLAYKDSSSLVNIWGRYDKEGIPRNWLSEPEYWDLIDRMQSFSALGIYTTGSGVSLTSSDAPPVQASAALANAALFPVLGVQPMLGRNFSSGPSGEDQPGRDHVAILSYALWRSQFGGNPNIVGKSIQLDRESYFVVGVLPKDFFFAGKQDLWLPAALNRAKPTNRGSHSYFAVARLKPEVTIPQASAELDRFAAQLAREYPDNYPAISGWGMFLVPLKEQLVGKVRPALLVLLGAVAFVLLIACVNIANLLLANGSAREREFAVRAALGAERWRVIRQLVTESLMLAFAGGVLGLVIAYWGVGAVRALLGDSVPRVDEIRVDPFVLGFTFVVSILTGLIFGLAPAWHSAKTDLQDALKDGGRGGSVGSGGRKLRGVLVVTEIALAVLLLVGAGLLIRSFRQLIEVSPGFQTQHLLTMEISLPEKPYPDGAPVQAFFKQLTERVSAIPGVQAAGAVSQMPLSDSYSSGTVFVQESSAANLVRLPKFENRPLIEADRRVATPGYFQALQIPLVHGRYLADADSADAPLVAVVDTDFAKRFWPNEDAIGKQVSIDGVPNSDPDHPVLRWRTVVGVVGHVRHYGLDTQGREQAYFPHAQIAYSRDLYLAVRTTVDPSSVTNAIRQQVAAIDSEVPLYNIAAMDELLSHSVAQPRLNLTLLVAFASIALLLAAVGVYGVMAYAVVQRTQELGIRMALGATQGDVLKLVLFEGGRLAAIGLGVGLLASVALTRLMASLLFGVKPTDPVTFALVAAVLACVALIACYIPAQRATKVDPLIALRYE
ncbi:MAG TPA: ABC transporter permease [Candidatus Acidoferrales bacterium]|nr:ABC transporter permease [Candidatus Acidoferrales bacterium]